MISFKESQTIISSMRELEIEKDKPQELPSFGPTLSPALSHPRERGT